MTPVERDDQLVRRHLAALDTALAQLRRHAGKPVALLASNLDERWAVERGLLVCAQSCIDIANERLDDFVQFASHVRAALGSS
jgi:uncharacterized protein YutE (UPF0331/DUF86 family)